MPVYANLMKPHIVIGYSWVKSHQLILANIGVGVAVGWKRAYVLFEQLMIRIANF